MSDKPPIPPVAENRLQPLSLTERERNTLAYACMYYAKVLDEADAKEPYTGTLETPAEVRAIEQRLRRLVHPRPRSEQRLSDDPAPEVRHHNS